MSRIAAAYNALHEHLEPNEAADTVDYCCADLALAAADAVMFSDEAIERAAKALALPLYGCPEEYWDDLGEREKGHLKGYAHMVVAALKGDQ